MTVQIEPQALPPASGRETASGKNVWHRARSWRFLPIDTDPAIVAFVQQPVGKFAAIATFAVFLAVANAPHAFRLSDSFVPVAVAICILAERRRTAAVIALTLVGFIVDPSWIAFPRALQDATVFGLTTHQLRLLAAAAVLVVSVAMLKWVRRFPKSALSRRPVLTVMLLVGALCTTAAANIFHGRTQLMLWAFAATAAALMWFLCYALIDQRAGDPSRPAARLGAFHPFWGSTNTPFGKGLAYLRRHEAKDSTELAVTRLKGVKLAAWVCVLRTLSRALFAVAVGLHVPPVEASLRLQVAGTPLPWYICWASVIYTFLADALDVAAFGNLFVAGARMAGYRLLRNSCRPLSSRTIAEFWNRYYYYYKELLVDLFFFPVFLRYFKKHKRLRVAFATFMAAGVGNFCYHVFRDNALLADRGVWPTIVGYQTAAFYCTALSASISVSQLRRRPRTAPRGWARDQLLPSLGVILYYCLLEVFMVSYSPFSLADHFRFLLRLVGVHA